MRKISKSPTFRTIIVGVSGALLIGNMLSCNKEKGKPPLSNSQPSPGLSPTIMSDYSPNDVQKMQDFFNQNSRVAGKTNADIFKENNPNFDINQPFTWQVNETLKRTKFDNHQKPYRLISINFSGLQMGQKVAGILDLSKCDAIRSVKVEATGIEKINIPKNSYLGKYLWYMKNNSLRGIHNFRLALAHKQQNNPGEEKEKLENEIVDEYFNTNQMPASDDAILVENLPSLASGFYRDRNNNLIKIELVN